MTKLKSVQPNKVSKAQVKALYEHACALGDLAGETLRYIENTSIPHTYPGNALVLDQLLKESTRRSGLLIDLSEKIAGN